MADRKEDIVVRIVADYAKALADIQRFTGQSADAINKLPKAVRNVGTEVDKLGDRAGKAAANIGRMTGAAHAGFDALPKVVQNLANGVDNLNRRIDALPKLVQNLTASFENLDRRIALLGQSDGPGRLGRNLGNTNQEATGLAKTFDKLLLTGKGIGAAMAGWQAGKAVLGPVVDSTMDYNKRLAYVTNVTANGANDTEKSKIEARINAGLEDARHQGGGKRDDVMMAFEALMARNVIGDEKQTMAVMPGILKTATAGNASPQDIAQASMGLIKSLGVAPEDNERALAILYKSGQDGGAELKNMARYLPAQSAGAKSAGMSGLPAVPKIAALFQMAVNYSGTVDQAGINVSDFMDVINSDVLAKSLKRFSYDKKNHALVKSEGNKRTGKNFLDLSHMLAENAEHGIDAVDTMIQLIAMVTKGDPKYAEAVKKRDAAKLRLNEAKKKGDSAGQVAANQELVNIGDTVVKILEGRGVNQLFHNQNSKRGGYGALTDPDEYHAKTKQYDKEGTIAFMERDLGFIKQHPSYKTEMYEQDKAAALYNGMEGFNGWLGKLADGAGALYERHPVLAAAMEGGKVGVMTMGAASGAAALVMTLLTRNAAAAAFALGGVGAAGGGRGPGAGGPGGPGGGPGAGNGPGATPRLGSMFIGGLKIGGTLAALGAGLEAYGTYHNDQLTAQEKKIAYTSEAGAALGGTLGGAAAGALIGSAVPVVGTVIGGVIGAGLGSWAGRSAGTTAGEAMFGDAKLPAPVKPETFSENFALKKHLAKLDAYTAAVPPIALPPPVAVALGIEKSPAPVKQEAAAGHSALTKYLARSAYAAAPPIPLPPPVAAALKVEKSPAPANKETDAKNPDLKRPLAGFDPHKVVQPIPLPAPVTAALKAGKSPAPANKEGGTKNPDLKKPLGGLYPPKGLPQIPLPAPVAAALKVEKSPAPASKDAAGTESPALTKYLAGFDQNKVASPIPLPPLVNAAIGDSKPKQASAVPPVNVEPNEAMRKQMGNQGVNIEAMQRALTEGLKPLPIDARLKIDVAFNEMGKPYVQQQSVSGKGIRLDVGPMMMY